jgi:predicted transcriptional regulator
MDGEITDIAGSHAYTAEVDAIFLLAPVRENKYQRILTPVAGRFWQFTPEPLVLELSESGTEYRVMGTVAEVLPLTQAQNAKQKVLNAIKVLGKATADEVAEYLRSSGEFVASSHLRNMLAELVHDGKLLRSGDGKRGNPYIYSAVLIPPETEHQNKTPAVSSDVLIPPEETQQNKTPAVSSDVLIPPETEQQNNNPDGEPNLFAHE